MRFSKLVTEICEVGHWGSRGWSLRFSKWAGLEFRTLYFFRNSPLLVTSASTTSSGPFSLRFSELFTEALEVSRAGISDSVFSSQFATSRFECLNDQSKTVTEVFEVGHWGSRSEQGWNFGLCIFFAIRHFSFRVPQRPAQDARKGSRIEKVVNFESKFY